MYKGIHAPSILYCDPKGGGFRSKSCGKHLGYKYDGNPRIGIGFARDMNIQVCLNFFDYLSGVPNLGDSYGRAIYF